MRKNFGPLITFAFALLLPFTHVAATPDYWNCKNRSTMGEWDFGRAPALCNVNTHMEPSVVRTQYQPVVFDDPKSVSSERLRYMSGMFPVLRDVGTYYIKKRNPNVSAAEVHGFLEAFYTLAQKESFWSHYRNAGDGYLRYMRGDSGHGHGIMQVDDNSHQVALSEGKGVDMIYNMIYGLDIFYKAWTRSATASCVSSKSDYKTRARSSWSAYNGGSAQLCRWRNSSSPYAKFDQDFLRFYEAKAWRDFVKDQSAASPIDVRCLAEGRRPCGLPSVTPPSQQLVDGHLYRLANGSYCLFQEAALQCVNEYRDVACVEARVGRSLGAGENATAAMIAGRTIKTFDRNTLCGSAISGLIATGKNVTLKKDIRLRGNPETGTVLTTLKEGTTLTVLGFEVRDWQVQNRYYRVKSGTNDGYFFAGTKTDHASWATTQTSATPAPTEPTAGLARVGEYTKIVNSSGINLRQTPNGTLIENIPAQTVLRVEKVTVESSNSKVYYQVTHQGRTGHLFVGAIEPRNTLKEWAHVVPKPADSPTLYQLRSDIPYRHLKMCAGVLCLPGSSVMMGSAAGSPDRVRIESQSGDWSKVVIVSTGATGWIRTDELTEIKK